MKWKTTWSYLPLDYGTSIGDLENITQKTTFWNNLNGKKAKVKFTNRYGTKPMKMKEVVIAQKQLDSARVFAHTNLTLDGEKEILLLPGQEFYSDEVEFEICAGVEIVLFVYFEEKTEIQVSCCNWSKESWHTEYMPGGNYVREEQKEHLKSFEVYPFIDAYMNQADVLVGVDEIRLLTEEDVKNVTLFGDSITHMSYYSDALMEILYKKFPGKVTVLNKGLSGNKILTDASYIPEIPGHGKSSGDAGIKRFEKDVYGTETPEYVLLLEGVNDLMHPYFLNKLEDLPKTEELVSAYAAIASMAHQKGSKIYFSTILPLKHEAMPFGPEGEKIREEVNEWIRSQKEAEGVFDFAAVTAKDKERMKDELHIGDGLHPNKKGGIVMAQEVFRKRGIENGIITN